jgi:hypothetical protein
MTYVFNIYYRGKYIKTLVASDEDVEQVRQDVIGICERGGFTYTEKFFYD